MSMGKNSFQSNLNYKKICKNNFKLFKINSKDMLDEATITQKANQLLAEFRANPDWAIDEKNFKQGYFKALEWVLQNTGIIER